METFEETEVLHGLNGTEQAKRHVSERNQVNFRLLGWREGEGGCSLREQFYKWSGIKMQRKTSVNKMLLAGWLRVAVFVLKLPR